MSPPIMSLPSPDPTLIARNYAPQFEASQQLLDTIWTSVPPAGADHFEYTLMNVLGRSIGTYRALLQVLAGGYTDQAWMLNRSLFEDMVVGYWISLPAHRESAAKLVQERVEETNERIDRLRARLAESGPEGLGERDSSFDNLVERLDKRVEEIKPLWVSCGGDVGDLYVHLRVTNWMSNLTVHVSGHSLEETLLRGSMRIGRKRIYAYGQSNQVDERQMLYGFEFSAFRIGWLTRLLLIETGRASDRLDVSYEKMLRAAREWGPSQRAKVGPNDPCWCRSGTKRKRCHP